MQESFLFEYAVIRLVPQVERAEFINAGVILYCARKKFLECAISLNENKFMAMWPDADVGFFIGNLESFPRICSGGAGGGAIAALDMPERFRWLTASRSTIIQCSAVHPGLCHDPSETLQRLFEKLVM